ncbi:hypothetical protein B5D77_24685 [Microcystis sp. MC19]|uniref:PEP-CTERM protein-sorting domain-containing protein n=2 Tax=Microcystis aeruginosa TaxID=1126 RepID=I4FKP0_MICAE|nr:hypothetical protein B5D77_24685 [Microcystis sp. MC19]CCH96215.1 conserved hypothetical protein [Microcystis aeruginosa PCC 9717]
MGGECVCWLQVVLNGVSPLTECVNYMSVAKQYSIKQTIFKQLLFLLPSFLAWSNLPANSQPVGSGVTNGVFNSFASPFPYTDVNGIGTNQLDFSLPDSAPSFFKFDGTSFENVQVGQTFVLGTLSYKNGIGWIGLHTSELAVSSSSSTTTPFNFNQILTEQIGLDMTANGFVVDGVLVLATPEQAADILYFPNRPELGSFRIYENSTGTVEVLGRFGSLQLAGFGNAISGGFVDPTIDPIPTAPAVSVPESGNIAGLLAISIVGAASTLKRKLKPSQSTEKETTKVS